MSTNLEQRAREKQRKRESGRQASEAQRDKGRQRSRAREQHDNFATVVTKWEMLAATNVRWKWAAVKKKWTRKRTTFQSTKRVTKKFLEVSRCTWKVPFLLIRPIVVFHRSPALPSPILYFVWAKYNYYRELRFQRWLNLYITCNKDVIKSAFDWWLTLFWNRNTPRLLP